MMIRYGRQKDIDGSYIPFSFTVRSLFSTAHITQHPIVSCYREMNSEPELQDYLPIIRFPCYRGVSLTRAFIREYT